MVMEVSLRASSVSTLFDCPARWAAIHIDGEDMPTSGAAYLGSAVHHASALFDTPGADLSIDDAASETVEFIRHPKEDVRWSDISQRDAEKRGVLLISRYCREIAPTQTYVEVERELEPLRIRVDENLVIVLTGTLDRIREVERKRGVGEIKTGARAVDAEGRAATGAHKPQVGTYHVLAEQTLGYELELDPAVIALKTSGDPEIAQESVPGAKDVLLNKYLPAAAMFFERGIFPGNPRSMLCTKKYCPIYSRCEWRG